MIAGEHLRSRAWSQELDRDRRYELVEAGGVGILTLFQGDV